MFQRLLSGLIVGSAILSSVHAQPVTYQGRLSGSPAPTIDIQATLYTTSGGTTTVGSSSISDDVPVSSNLFTTAFDFGTINYDQPLFMELVIRDGTSTVPFSSLTPLLPRVELTPVPLAYAAVNDAVDDADADDTNELNTSLDLTSTTLSLTDAGGTLMVDLAPIIPAPPFASPTDELQNLNQVLSEGNDAGGLAVTNLSNLQATGLIESNNLIVGNGNINNGGGNAVVGANTSVFGSVSSNSVILGGSDHIIATADSVSVGGFSHNIGGTRSVGIGTRTDIDHDHVVAINVDDSADLVSSKANTILLNSPMGVGINNNNPMTALDVTGTVTASSFVGDGSLLTNLPISSTGNTLDAADGTPSPAVFVDNEGRTGFGTIFPQQEIDIRVVDGTEAAASFTAETPVPNTSSMQDAAVGGNVGGGPVAWTNPNGVSPLVGPPASVSTTNGDESQILRASNFGLSIPSGATITGVRVNYFRELTDPNPFNSSVDGMTVRLYTGTSNAPITRLDNVDGSSPQSWGNSTDLWGLSSGTLTPALVNSPNFGFDFQVLNTPSEGTDATLEDVVVTIFYNPNQTIQTTFTTGVADGAGDFVVSQSNDLSNPVITVEPDGRVGLNNTSPGAPLRVGTNTTNGNGAFVTNGGTWTSASSREWKSNFQSVDSFDVLNKLAQIPIMTWEYDNSEEGIHLGPVAEDFYKAFGLGQSEQYISTVDADGVALIAIQALEKENNELQKKNEELEARLEKLEQMLLEK